MGGAYSTVVAELIQGERGGERKEKTPPLPKGNALTKREDIIPWGFCVSRYHTRGVFLRAGQMDIGQKNIGGGGLWFRSLRGALLEK
jgi:hypothetical protein